jgi:small-conductance mechanosensitive channel
MLLVAAERTSGLLKDPALFVLQTSLGDFAVSYELNAYSTIRAPWDGSIRQCTRMCSIFLTNTACRS